MCCVVICPGFVDLCGTHVCVYDDNGCVLCCVCVCCCKFLVQFYTAWYDARCSSDLVLADARVQLIHDTRWPTSRVATWIIDCRGTLARILTTIRTDYMSGGLHSALEIRRHRHCATDLAVHLFDELFTHVTTFLTVRCEQVKCHNRTLVTPMVSEGLPPSIVRETTMVACPRRCVWYRGDSGALNDAPQGETVVS